MPWLQTQQSSQGNFWLNFPRVAEKKEQRSVKFQKRTILASPWRNAGRTGITFVVFEAHLPQCTTAGTAHLTAPWPALKEEIQERWTPAWSLQTQRSCGPDQKGKKAFQVWGTAAVLLRLEESKRTVDLNSRSYSFILPSLQENSFQDCAHYFTLYRSLKCFTDFILWGP